MATNQSNTSDEEEKKKVLTIANGIAVDAVLQTGEQIDVHTIPFRPIIDSHMHIQSLNATPMTLQWATLYKGSYKIAGGLIAQKKQGEGRKSINDTASGWLASTFATKQFGSIGRFSTDIVAKIYMNESKNSDMKKSLYWLLWDKEKIEKFEKKKKDMLEKAGDKLGLEALSKDRQRDLRDFYKMAAYYYQRTQVFHMSIVMPMDLSYAHFWGEHGIPMYLPVLEGNGFRYIDDFVQISAGRDWKKLWTKKNLYIENIYAPENKPDDHLHHMSYDYDLDRELYNYLYYMGNKFGLEGYDDELEMRPFLIVFDHETLQAEIEAKEFEIKKLENELYDRQYTTETTEEYEKIQEEYKGKMDEVQKKMGEDFKTKLDETKEKYREELTQKDYKHYINDIRDDNTEMFEDYYLQRALTEASAFRYPLQMITFNHYDPRRYYSSAGDVQTFADLVKEKHGFYSLSHCDEKLDDAFPELVGRASLTNFDIHGSKENYFLEMLKDRTRKDNITKKVTKKIKGTMEDNQITLDKLYPSGCFMGVKVYPALGYPGDIFDRKKTESTIKKVDQQDYHYGSHYYDDQFKGLLDVYKHLIDNDMPITSHCSPQGMSIGDAFNYVYRDENAKREDRKESYDPTEVTLFMDHICGDPDNWQRVLDYPGLKELKICLAHFGGMGFWTGKMEDEEWPEDYGSWKTWGDKICTLIDDYPNVFTDISCYVMDTSGPPSTFSTYKWSRLMRGKLKKVDKVEGENRRILERYYKLVIMPDSGHQYYRLEAYNVDEKSTVRTVLRSIGYIKDNIKDVGTKLITKLNESKGDKLKERILMGSDWYMSEMSITGVGSYYARMFELLKMVSEKVGYDAWHQFSVVNPLNYLGFLKKSGGKPVPKTNPANGKKYYEVDIERIEKLLSNLDSMGQDSEWKKFAEIKDSEQAEFADNSKKILEQLKKCTIYTAEEMMKDGELMILTDQ